MLVVPLAGYVKGTPPPLPPRLRPLCGNLPQFPFPNIKTFLYFFNCCPPLALHLFIIQIHAMEMDGLLDSYNFGYLISLVSFCLFYLNNWCLLSELTPKSASTAKYQQWKWRNIANSFIHSSITGFGACLCFWQSPGMREDLIYKFSHSSHFLIAVSIGYFFYDLIDMSLNDRSSKKYELLLHHFLVILCFGVAMVQKLYLGYALMALLLEVNSIFLHLRQLMIIQQWSKGGALFRINNSFNLGTFVVFRILTLGWMTRWLLQHRTDLAPLAFNLAGISLAVIMCMNIVLLQRVLNSDYRQCPPKPAAATMPMIPSDEKVKIR